jgi:hypothetical protein
VIHGERKIWRREEGGLGEDQRGREAGLWMGMDGKGGPPGLDKEWKVWGRWAKDRYIFFN